MSPTEESDLTGRLLDGGSSSPIRKSLGVGGVEAGCTASRARRCFGGVLDAVDGGSGLIAPCFWGPGTEPEVDGGSSSRTGAVRAR